MKNAEVAYLRPDVIAEPLVNRWYATSFLVSPMTAPRLVALSHLPTMRSFVMAPMVHIKALADPGMSGGSYIGYPAERVDEIKALIAETLSVQAPLLAFSDAITDLERVLALEAKGFSMAPLYAKVPAGLRGYVELTYDLNCQPAIRYLEGLLYRSPAYRQETQSIALSRYKGDGRPFILSSPKLDEPDVLHIQKPFQSAAWDALFRSRSCPVDPMCLAEQFELGERDRAKFQDLFTPAAPERAEPWRGEGVRVRYFGHACVLIESAETSILVDPQIAYPNASGPDRFTFQDLPERIDYVMFTHNHHDHVILETLLPIRHRIRNLIVPKSGGALADPSLRLMFKHIGFPTPYELEEMETIDLPGGGELTGLPFLGEHGDLNIRGKLAYHVQLQGRKFFLGADSDNVDSALYENIARVLGPVDAMFIGLECDGAPQGWIYGPLATRKISRQMDQTRRLCSSDFDKCAAMMTHLRPDAVYIYAMGREPWLSHLTALDYAEDSKPLREARRLVEHCRERGVAVEDLYCRKELHFEPAGIRQIARGAIYA
jgi:L-ascorbate metabolism protein UlaG (beta-lactamase superfamily)